MTARKSDAKAPGAKPRPYRTPRLVRYGTIVELTQNSLSKVGGNDALAIKMVGFFKSV